jgi:hypothetical protein
VRREHGLYALGSFGVAVHAVDHLVSDPEWYLLFAGAVAASALTVVIAFVYSWLPTLVRALAGLGLGSMWAVAAFVHHVLGLAVGGPAPTDYSGVPAALGGALMVLAGWQAWRQADAPGSWTI